MWLELNIKQTAFMNSPVKCFALPLTLKSRQTKAAWLIYVSDKAPSDEPKAILFR